MNEDARSAHWSEYREAAAGYWHVKLILIFFRIFPVVLLRIISFGVSFFYYLFSARARRESRRYLERINTVLEQKVRVGSCCSGFLFLKFMILPLAHITAFSLTLIEKVEAWGGKA
jgi:predicted LPLAT superfamily acyltransferase